jgi:hypothetical protein
MFNRQDMTDEELIDDAECIGGLELDHDRPPFLEKRSMFTRFDFQPRISRSVLGAMC